MSCCRKILLNKSWWINSSSIRYAHTNDGTLPMKKLNITSYAPVQYRHEILSELGAIVTRCGGYVNDYNFFSDLAVSLQILGLRQPDSLTEFYQQLTLNMKTLRLDTQTIHILDNQSKSTDQYLLFILFQILFIDAKDDLRQNVPTVQN
ncbi:unnamed protein product [Adineta ricciae]|uniref:Uncharacterized protein n=1 Tax=Adineta ricciae TaxID=249248 RepID=A0A815QPR9_ADIRI|nr:unnamed protein product [Adineta ricciae]CAF1635006.1 unnamed protein product [Adineta ricciae]